ncbi:MAG: protein kinase [Pseudomonadota bacterium]
MAVDIHIEGYTLAREIGHGGMARVFLGTQTSLGREVAVKVLRRSLSGEDFQRRFLHEGQLLAKLNHPNIVPIHDIGQKEEHFYMAMEYLKGGTLSERMKNGISVAECIRICTQIAHALHLAHTHSIVHRDLKPSNIMFRDELTPVLTDFGIARKTDSEHRLTKTGMVVGTPYYMSPEQITGKDIDGRADLYSLGIMFFELMTGELPFKAEEPLALAMQHVQETPPPLPETVAELQPIMDVMLAKDKDDRYPDMLGFCEAVKELVMTEAAFAERLSGETKLFNSDQFSDPRFGSGPLRVPERVTRDLARSSGQRGRSTAPPAASTRAATAVGSRPAPASSRPKWLVPAAIAVVLALGVGVTLVATRDTSGLSDKQRAVVDNLLQQIDEHIVFDRIREPADDNAVALLRDVLSVAPDYAPAQQRAEEVAVIYERDARALLMAGNTDSALAMAQDGLTLDTDSEPLTDLVAEIDAEITAAENRQQVIALNFEAQGLFASGSLMTPAGANALEKYDAALALDPQNRAAAVGRNRVQTTVAAQAREALRGGDLDQATALVQLLEDNFSRSTLVAEVRSELNNLTRAREEAAQIATLLKEAQQLVTANALIDPPGRSAVDRFQAVLRIDSANATAKQGLASIAAGFQERANEALAAEDFSRAVDLASAGLRAEADNPTLAQIQQQATGALDAVDREIQESLQEAERLARAGSLLSDGPSNARSAYQRVLELDPDNVRALAAIDDLPDQVFSRIRQLRRSNDLIGAGQLASLAVTNFPDDARFATLGDAITAEQESQAQQARLASLVQDARRLIAASPLDQTAISAAATSLDDISSEFPNNVQVSGLFQDLARNAANAANQASLDGNDAAALSLAEHALSLLPDNSTLLRARNDISARQTRREREEEARLAALRGRLAIDARPWGEVIEVTGPNGTTELPEDATTPLVLSVPEGRYQIVVRGGGTTAPITLSADVERQRLVRARAEFSELDATSYFERSGW